MANVQSLKHVVENFLPILCMEIADFTLCVQNIYFAGWP